MLVYPSIARDIYKKHKNEKQTQEQEEKTEQLLHWRGNQET